MQTGRKDVHGYLMHVVIAFAKVCMLRLKLSTCHCCNLQIAKMPNMPI